MNLTTTYAMGHIFARLLKNSDLDPSIYLDLAKINMLTAFAQLNITLMKRCAIDSDAQTYLAHYLNMIDDEISKPMSETEFAQFMFSYMQEHNRSNDFDILNGLTEQEIADITGASRKVISLWQSKKKIPLDAFLKIEDTLWQRTLDEIKK